MLGLKFFVAGVLLLFFNGASYQFTIPSVILMTIGCFWPAPKKYLWMKFIAGAFDCYILLSYLALYFSGWFFQNLPIWVIPLILAIVGLLLPDGSFAPVKEWFRNLRREKSANPNRESGTVREEKQ